MKKQKRINGEKSLEMSIKSWHIFAINNLLTKLKVNILSFMKIGFWACWKLRSGDSIRKWIYLVIGLECLSRMDNLFGIGKINSHLFEISI